MPFPLKRFQSSRSVNKMSGSLLHVVDDVRLLERQPRESPEAYEAWSAYANGKFKEGKSMEQVARELSKSRQLLVRWASRWNWKDRFRLFQNQQRLIEEQERRKAIAEAEREWARRKVGIREEGFTVGDELIKRGRRLLELPMWDRTVKGIAKDKNGSPILDPEGKEIPTLTELVFHENPRDARGFIELGVKLKRQSADMLTEQLPVEDDDIDFDAMSPEELLEFADRLAAIRKLESGAGGGGAASASRRTAVTTTPPAPPVSEPPTEET